MTTDLVTIIQGEREQFLSVAVTKGINFDREASFALQMLETNEYLARVATENVTSLRNAINNIAALGITLNPAQKFAYLVPRKIKNIPSVCLDISYMGFLNAAQESGAIRWGQARVVRDSDTFELQGIDQPPTHTYDPLATNRGDLKGAYVVVKTDTEDYLTHAMTIKDIYDIRDRSEMWKKNKSGPWLDFEEEMVKKTCVKQAYKYWPRRKQLDDAIHYMNTTGGEGIDFSSYDSEIKRGKIVPSSTSDMASLDEGLQNQCHDLSIEITDLWNDQQCWKAKDRMKEIQQMQPFPEFGCATWHLLASHITTGLKKYEVAEANGERGEDE